MVRSTAGQQTKRSEGTNVPIVTKPVVERDLELTILMPCLNEEETVEKCVSEALSYLDKSGVRGEVLVADNGSTDASVELAQAAGARVVQVEEKGYGSALRGGIASASGTFIIMADADCSYDFGNLDPFMAELRQGKDLVMGNRFAGGIEKGAMPALHRYLGNPVLSFLARLFFRSKVGDFHCGLRGFRADAIRALNLRTTGMEFASEMVVKAELAEYEIAEVPTVLRPDGRSRPPHLRSWRDGWRHLRFLLLHCPNWLFIWPSAILVLLGLMLGVLLALNSRSFGDVTFGVNSLVVVSGLVQLGFIGLVFGTLAKLFASRYGVLPITDNTQRIMKWVSLERALIVGLSLVLLGLIGVVFVFVKWAGVGFGDLDTERTRQVVVPSVTGISVGLILVFGGFLGSLFELGDRGRRS
jgi:glycosyltransferase involved in cell wall biosynthesis